MKTLELANGMFVGMAAAEVTSVPFLETTVDIWRITICWKLTNICYMKTKRQLIR